MQRVYVHSTAPYLEVVRHEGQWSWELPDGTYFIAIGHSDGAYVRHVLGSHQAVTHILPSRQSGGVVGQKFYSSLNSWLGRTPYQAMSAPTPLPTEAVLAWVYSQTGDPAFHPESSM